MLVGRFRSFDSSGTMFCELLGWKVDLWVMGLSVRGFEMNFFFSLLEWGVWFVWNHWNECVGFEGVGWLAGLSVLLVGWVALLGMVANIVLFLTLWLHRYSFFVCSGYHILISYFIMGVFLVESLVQMMSSYFMLSFPWSSNYLSVHAALTPPKDSKSDKRL